MKTTSILSLIALIAISAFAAEITYNGGFETCVPDSKGIPQPWGWNKTRTVAKKAEVSLVKDAQCVKSGKFALYSEVGKGGNLFFRSLKEFPIATGDTLEMEIYTKGTGKYSLQYIVNGSKDGKKYVFLTTCGTGRYQVANEEKWQKYTPKVTFTPPAKAKGKFDKFVIIPVIVAEGDSELYFDDFAIKVTKKAK